MKLKKSFDKIKQSSDNMKVRTEYTEPFIIFQDYFGDNKALWKYVEKNHYSARVKLEARKNVIVNLVTCYEIYMKDLLNYFFKHKIIKNKFKFVKECDKAKLQIQLIDLLEMSSKRITHNNLIVESFSFFDVEEAKRMLTYALGLPNLNKKMRDVGYDVTEADWNFLQDVIELRHSFIHDMDMNVKLTKKKTEEIIEFTEQFIESLDWFVTFEEYR